MSQTEVKDKVKELGQVFTPQNIVDDILNAVGYTEDILQKHIIDNSCGDGAFLTNIVERYIKIANKNGISQKQLAKELGEYIHGMEIDEETYLKCLENLKNVATKFGLKNIEWDIKCMDALNVEEYNGKMDFVVGNPPYIRVHNLNDRNKVKEFDFCKNGMTDMYIVFYEIGFKMLNLKGKLAYITPNSFYNSVAGKTLRKYILKKKNLYKIIDLGHYQPFSASAYTTIMCFDNSKTFQDVGFYKYNLDGKYNFVAYIDYDELLIGNMFCLTNSNKKLKQIFNFKSLTNKVIVKNGIATLRDKIFIKSSFPFEQCLIDIIKASTGEWYKCLFPYDNDGNILPFETLQNEIASYLTENKDELEKRNLDNNATWYSFGRSQGIKDIFKNKIAINTTIKDLNSIKINQAEAGQAVFSGLYILTNESLERIQEIVKNEDFLDYITTLNKCKSGGYYTFSSKDLEIYLNYQLSKGEKDE